MHFLTAIFSTFAWKMPPFTPKRFGNKKHNACTSLHIMLHCNHPPKAKESVKAESTRLHVTLMHL